MSCTYCVKTRKCNIGFLFPVNLVYVLSNFFIAISLFCVDIHAPYENNWLQVKTLLTQFKQ